METNLSLNDIKEINPTVFEDFRGEIYTIYDSNKYNINFNHDKICNRSKNVLVGLHGDEKTTKLVSCLYGKVFSVIVDCRKESPDYLKYKTFILSDFNKKQLLIPPNFANGFCVISDYCVYNYKLSYYGEYTDFDKQFTLRWDDPKLNIFWPYNNPILSERDKNAKFI